MQPVLIAADGNNMQEQIEMEATPSMLETIEHGIAEADRDQELEGSTPSNRYSKKKLIFIATFAAIVTTIAITVPVVLTTSGGGNDDGNSSGATGTMGEGQADSTPISTIPTFTPIANEPTAIPMFDPSSVPSTSPSTTAPTCADAQRCALQAIFESTNGDTWNQNDNWLMTSSICEWYGVSCGTDGISIEALDLSENGLAGILPLGEFVWEGLGSIVMVDLSENSISGPIPSGIGMLSNLISLSLNSNSFTGTLPTEFGKLKSLQILSIEYNDLNGLISEDGPICELETEANLFVFNSDCSPMGVVCECCFCFA